VRQEFNEDEIK